MGTKLCGLETSNRYVAFGLQNQMRGGLWSLQQLWHADGEKESNIASMRQPLREDSDGSDAEAAQGAARTNGDAEADRPSEVAGSSARDIVVDFIGDAFAIVLFIGFYQLLSVNTLCAVIFWVVVGIVVISWRLAYFATPHPGSINADIPYTCGFAAVDGREVYLVATLHIAPRAPKDVEAVINNTNPDIVMIELDEERLHVMREPVVCPKPADLQPIKVTIGEQEPTTLMAQRAYWNADCPILTVDAEANIDSEDPYCIDHNSAVSFAGNVAVANCGGPGRLATFALKTHTAARRGASALVLVNPHDNFPPVPRLGMVSVSTGLKVAWGLRSCSFPSVPMLLLPKEGGSEMLTACRSQDQRVKLEFQALPDAFPRRSLRRQICQNIGIFMSGVGVLYWIIECFSVDSGDEFVMAESVASSRNIPCVCVDVDMNRLCSRVTASLKPTPRNIWFSARAWFRFPRLALQAMLPARGDVDVLGSMFLHFMSFRCRIWLALVASVICAGTVVGFALFLLVTATAGAASGSGIVKGDTTDVQTIIMLALEMYVVPRVYDAIAASRDEAMYRSIVQKATEHDSRRLVVVVGAAHANGILHKVRTRGIRQSA